MASGWPPTETTAVNTIGPRSRRLWKATGAPSISLPCSRPSTTICNGGGCLTRHSHYLRVCLGGVTIWRLQCTTCRAVFTILPHFILRYRQMRPEVARDALLATHRGLSLEWCAVICNLSPMAFYRLVCAFGHHSLVTVLTRCGLPLPLYVLADEKHSTCLADKVYLPTIVCGRVLWHLGYTTEASAVAFNQSYRAFQQAALQQDPSYRVKGVLTDGFDSTTKSMRTLFPGARLGICLRHTLLKLPKKLTAITTPLRQALRAQITPCGTGHASGRAYGCLRWASDCGALRTTSRTQPGRPKATVYASGFRPRGWYAVLEDPQMPVASTLLDQAHNAVQRKLFAMKGFHHPGGSQQAFLTGLAHLYNLVPYQRRAQHAGQCGVEVEGGHVPTSDWMLNLPILTSGGSR